MSFKEGITTFPPPLVARLEVLPGFRNVLVHEYVGLDMRRVVEALNDLEPLEQFTEIVRQILILPPAQ